MKPSTLQISGLRAQRSGAVRPLVPLLFLWPALVFGQSNYTPYTFTTLAGAAAPGSADGLRSRARFDAPSGLAVDPAGILYVADTGNSTIRRIAPDGTVTTIAGLAGITGAADGTGYAARFNQPAAVAVDAAGAVYVADAGNDTIRKIAPDGTVSTVAGSPGEPGAVDGAGRDARFNGPEGVAVDSSGNIYVADTGNHTLRKITPDGAVTTVAGLAGSFGDTDGTGSAARFNQPSGLTVDAAGTIYVGQWHSGATGAIRKVTVGGQVTTVAVTGPYPAGLAVDAAGNVYAVILDYSLVEKVTPDGTLVWLAGSLGQNYQIDTDGQGYAASFRWPSGIAIDAAGTVYVADTGNNAIRKGTPPDPSADMLWAAGSNADGQLGDGTAIDRATPVAIRAGVMGAAAGQSHSLLVTTDGILSSTGANAYGQLGDATVVARNVYARVSDYSKAVAAGANHSLFLRYDGSLWTAGRNHYGQLGDGTTTDRTSPVLINGNSDPYFSIRAVAAGADHSLFLDSVGTLWGMGYNGYGQLGVNAGSIVTKPVPIATDVRAIAAGGEHSLFIKTDGTLWGMGYNRLGQLGDGTAADRATPVPIAADVWQVAAGYHFSLFVKTDGTLWGMGESASGELGGMYGDVITPIQIATGVRAISAGQSHSLFVKTDATLWAMGDNHYGQLGDGTTTASLAPVRIADHVRTIAAGYQYSLFVVDYSVDGSLPAITASPRDQIVTNGQNANFFVAFDSTSPAACRWQRRARNSATWIDVDDHALSNGHGSAAPGISIPATAAADGDSYRCVITNVNGLVLSDAAKLSVVQGTPLTVATLAGSPMVPGATDGTGTAARLRAPVDVAADGAGNVYIADTDNHVIRKITPAGVVTTVAGLAGITGSADGTGSAARFNHPAGLAADTAGNIFVSDTDNDTIRGITPAGAVTTLAGAPQSPGATNGSKSAARFNRPTGIVADAAGVLYVADTQNHTIRKVTSDGVVTLVSTIAGYPGESGSADGSGGFGGEARFSHPEGLALDGLGNLYVADSGNSAIRKVVLANPLVSTVAGQPGVPGSDDGPAASARFNYPCAVTVDATGNLLVADTDNQTIRQIAPDGTVTTVAGLAGNAGGADGVGAAAHFAFPTGITTDAARNLYIADTNNHTIRIAYVPAAPVITAQPLSESVAAGANPQFAVTASGKPGPTYQWLFNGTAINGATARTLQLSNVQASSAGTYAVTVTNASGSVTSNPATLTVSAATTTPSPSGGSGTSSGGGAMEAWFVALLALLAAGRRHPGNMSTIG